MDEFDPIAILRCLNDHHVEFVVVGGVAARLRGAPLLTQDVDVTPSLAPGNLKRLAAAVEELQARLRTPGDPDGVPISFDPLLIESSKVWTLTTRSGDLDLVVSPAGTNGYKDLIRSADRLVIAVDPEVSVPVASLADVIRIKEAAGRDKDRAGLPLLRRTLEESGN